MAEKIKGITVEIGGDTQGLTKALKAVNSQSKNLQTELNQVNRLLKLDPKNVELLAQKEFLLGKQVEINKSKLEALKKSKKDADEEMKKGTKINQEQYRELQREIVYTSQKLESLGNTVEKSNSKIGNIGGVAKGIGKGVLTAGKAVVTGVMAIGAGMVAATESTREYREDMSRLDTAFVTSGKTTEQAKKSYEGFYQILGESDRSVEAVNHLAKLCNSEQELSQWTDICAGVSATFGDSLPIEGLTEAANETAKVGKVTGPLADALNWAGLSEDDFNNKLQACSNEQERSKLITETLGNTYKEAADKFKESNQDVMASREANVKFQESLAKIGKICEQIITPLKTISSEGLEKIADGLERIFNGDMEGGLQSIQNGINGFITQIMQKIPDLLNVALPILAALAQALVQNLPVLVDVAIQIISMLGQFIIDNVPLLIDTALQIVLQLANAITQAYPNLYPAIADIMVKIVDTLLNNIDKIIDAAINLIMAFADGIMNALPILLEKVPEIIVKLVAAIIRNAPKILIAGVELIAKLWNGVLNGIKAYFSGWATTIYNTIVQPIKNKFSEMLEAGKYLLEGLWNGINDKVQWLKDKVSGVVDKIKGWFTGKDGFDEHSPSKWAKEVGDFVMEGLANGITENMSVEEKTQKKLDNIKNFIKKNIDSITTEINQGIEGIQKDISQKEDSFASSLTKANLYDKHTYKINGETYSRIALNSFDKETAQNIQWANDLVEVEKRLLAISSNSEHNNNFMQLIRNMGIENGSDFTSALLSADNQTFKDYIEGWQAYQNSATLAAAQTYSTQSSQLQTDFLSEVENGLNSVVETFQTSGMDSAENFGNGFMDKMKGVMAQIQEKLQSYNQSFSLSGEALKGIGKTNTSYDNHSTNTSVTINNGNNISSAYEQKQQINRLLNKMALQGAL